MVRNWRDVRADAGLDEAEVSEHRQRLDDDQRTPEMRGAYLLGACYAEPYDRWCGHDCETCDEARGYLADPVLAAEFQQGKREQEVWVRMCRVRRMYGQRRRRRR